MKTAKRKRVEAAGWRLGSAQEFLGLSDQEAAFVELKLALGSYVRRYRIRQRWTQTALAARLGSSQSRVAKVEAGDATVSLDLQVRALLALGGRPRDVAKALKDVEVPAAA